MKRILWIISTILWTGFIFYNSLMTGLESGSTSNSIVNIFLRFLNLFNIQIDPSFASLLIRKGAHFFEFFVLGLLVYNVIKTFVLGKKKSIYKNINVYSFIFVLTYCLLIAITDETIQYFVPGRYASIVDVMIDFSGSLFFVFIIVILNYKKIKSTLNKTK